MRFLQVNENDTSNGPGFRVSLFVSYCPLHCEGCWNPVSWNARNGELYSSETTERILSLCDREYVSGLSVLGGEPLAKDENSDNLSAVGDLVESFREKFGHDKTIWMWTGFMWEDIMSCPDLRDVVSSIDVLVDGPYVKECRDLSLRFRGSSNQRLIDVRKTLESGSVCLWRE